MTTTTPSPRPGIAEAGTLQALELGLVHGSAPWSENQAKKHEKLPENLRRTLAKWREIIEDRKESMRLCPEHSKAYRAEIETLTGCIKDVESLLPNDKEEPMRAADSRARTAPAPDL